MEGVQLGPGDGMLRLYPVLRPMLWEKARDGGLKGEEGEGLRFAIGPALCYIFTAHYGKRRLDLVDPGFVP